MNGRWRVAWQLVASIALILLLAMCGLSGFVVAQVNADPHNPVVIELGTVGVSARKRPILPGSSSASGGSAIWFGRIGGCRTTGSPLILGDIQVNVLRCRR